MSTKALVDRARLIEVLRAGHSKKLTVIHGPTGFGKSTLAAQWAKLLTAEGVAVAWLTVDHDDNNVVWFLSHLIEAIRAVTPALATELGEVLEEHGDEAERYVLTSLINEIHQSGTRMTLVIDDWQRVTDPATIGALLYLLVYASDDLTVVVTSRSQSGLPMSRMRMQDELVEIDATALRFDVAESENFLVELSGLDLDHADVEELTAKTDGWVAALQLASLSLRGRDDPVRLIGTMTGRHHAISEFLAENVLDTLEPSMLDFLLATSITERICGDLASALSGVPDGQAMLEQVEERDLFLRRIDEQWFRYHQLFGDFLRHRLGRDDPERVVRLHRVASTWFAEHQLVSEAVDHALAAGDDERAVKLVENDGIDLVANSQMATLIGLVGKLPPAVVKSDPRLQLALAWANIVLHRIPAAEQALGLMESGLDDVRPQRRRDRRPARGRRGRARGGRPALRPARRHRRAHRAVSGATRSPASVRRRRGRHRGDLRRRVSLRPRRSEPDPGVGGTLQRTQPGHLQHGSRTVLQGARAPVDARHPDGGNLLPQGPQDRQAVRRQPFLHGPAGEFGAGRIALRARRSRRGGPPVGGGLQARARGRLGRLQDRPIRHRRQDQGAAGRPARGRPTTRRGCPGRAHVVTEAAAGDGRARAHPPRASSASGFRSVAGDVLQTRRTPVDAIDEITVQFEEASAIRMLIAADDPASKELACRWAQEWVDRTASPNRPQALLRARRLLGACLSAAGRVDEAKTTIATVAAQCAQLGMLRYLVDGGPYVAATLSELQADQRAGRWRPEWPEIPPDFLDQAVNAASRAADLTAARSTRSEWKTSTSTVADAIAREIPHRLAARRRSRSRPPVARSA